MLSVGHYRNGRRHGLWRFARSDGEVVRTVCYVDGQPTATAGGGEVAGGQDVRGCAPRASGDAVVPKSPSRCQDVQGVERLEIPAVEAKRARSLDLTVSYDSLEHDTYDDGRTEQIVHLTFRTATDEQTWLPSVRAPSRFILDRLGHCVRLVNATAATVTVEVARPSGRAP